jgi:hypothetical protein
VEDVSKDSSEITAKFYLLNCRILTLGPYAEKFIFIDKERYKMGDQNQFSIRLRKGFHVMEINYPGMGSFFPITKKRFRFKKRRHYYVNVYLVSDTSNMH